MQQLWAPWRMQYIEQLHTKSSSGCAFCETLVSKDDKKNLLLFRGKTCFVLMNRFPYNNGHLLIIPNRHEGSLGKLNDEERSEMMQLSSKCVNVLTENFQAEGFNIGANLGKIAGAGIVDHIHMHVVPRWLGDTNFLPILTDTRSISEYLEITYDRLVDKFVTGQRV